MKKSIITLLIVMAMLRSYAIEGMYLPLLLKQLNEKEMQSMGMKLTAEDIYSVNRSSLKDAIVIFGRGCTGEVISTEGLVLTNHHCGYGAIQRHSSLARDYLTDGFWAMNRNEELPNQGLTVTFLVSMDNVTSRVLQGVSDDMTERKRDSVVRLNTRKIEKLAADSSGLTAQIRPFYYGNEYYLFLSETFRDVRLVGAPPSNIGKFGGDTDNWMWPRHTGDFAVFRIYADRNNKPADYSTENVPYKPKYHFPISLRGVEKGDFTMVFGYPGTTRQYLPSIAVENITGLLNPVAVKLRDRRLNTFSAAMNADKEVRIKYSAKHANIANGWKKMIGESKGIDRIKAVDRKREFENRFQAWASEALAGREQFRGIVPEFNRFHAQLKPLSLARTYINEAALGVELLRFALQFEELVKASGGKKQTDEAVQKILNRLLTSSAEFFKNYHQPIDRQLMEELLEIYARESDKAFVPESMQRILARNKNSFKALTASVFDKTIFASQSKLETLLKSYKPTQVTILTKDPAYILATEFNVFLSEIITPETRQIESKLDSLQRVYVQGLMAMQPEKRFYPDANSTLRVSYGAVDDYLPMDAVHYRHYTTIEGIMEKENPDIYDYVVEPKLKQLYLTKDYGRYADKNGQLRTCFIASNHTTGGNSGSPVINANGHLVGINFDRNWEGTMSDLMYDPDMCRNISIDIRYCLFVIDKFAGATHLINEMTIVE